jgi:hypothetical protein
LLVSRLVKIALLVVAAPVVAAALLWLPAGDWIRAAVTWVRGTGPVGVVVACRARDEARARS